MKKRFHQTFLRRFVVSPENRVLSTPKFDIQKFGPQQEQRVRNYLYKKSDILGKGYSSNVYKSHKVNQIYRNYAIKIIDLTKLNYQQRKYLENQLNIHKILSHPNIVKCYETFKSTSAYYLVLQYCSQGTLSDYLKNHKKLQENSAINIMLQVFQSYLYLMGQNILHRDLKPQNILRKDNAWKITDFGFSCHFQGQIFVDDINVGTPLYMPLQSLTKDIYSHKSDFFSMGIIVYKMLTGISPWKCNTQKQLINLNDDLKDQFPLSKKQIFE